MVKIRYESESASCSEDLTSASTSKSKQKSQGKKRKRESSESSIENEIIFADNALETERNVHASAVKNNLDETSVRKIIKKVVTNDHVLAFVKLQEEEESRTDDKNLQPKLTRAKVKELKKVATSKSSGWDLEKLELTPINHIPVKTRPEVKALIAQDLPDDEDDEEYEPNHDDVPSDDDHVESCSDLDSQPRTPATPAPPESPQVVKDGPFKVPQEVFTARRKLELEEEEATIALRTRSKLSLSATSIEHIESTFVPPDDLPMQDVDDLWNEFLNECLNPASAAKHEDDDEADPEYNVAADADAHDEDEEALSNSIIKISKKELNDLVTELFSILPGTEDDVVQLPSEVPDTAITNTPQWKAKQEPLSDDESGQKPSEKLDFEKDSCQVETKPNNADVKDGKETIAQTEKEDVQKETVVVPTPLKPVKSTGPRLTISTRNRKIEISIEEEERNTPAADARQEAPPSLRSKIQLTAQTVHIEVDSTVTMTQEQLLILQQQLRQHVQLATCNFMQTIVHPIHWKLAPTYKEYLESLVKLTQNKENSVVNVCNLAPAHELVATWEKSVTEDTAENREMIEFLQSEVEKSRRRISNNSTYGGQFHDTFKKVIANSTVFLYPSLLPDMPYRPDNTRRNCYLHSEDTLIVLGLDQFWQYVESNPLMYKLYRAPVPRARRGFVSTVELVSKHMFPWTTASRLAGHINTVRAAKDDANPIYRYFKYNEVPKTEHVILPYNPKLTLYEQPEHEMPRLWVRYLAKTSKRFRHFLLHRSSVIGRRPIGVQIHPGVTPAPVKPLPIDFTKQIISYRASLNQSTQPPLADRFDVNIQAVDPTTVDNPPLVAKNFYRLVETSTGAYLVPLQVETPAGNNSTGSISTPVEISTILANNLPESRQDSVIGSKEHCMCCVILKKICKKRQSLITEYFDKSAVRKCECNSISYPKISNRLRILVKSHKKASEMVFKELDRCLQDEERRGTEVKCPNSIDTGYALSYQLKVFTQASMSKRIYVKKRVSNLLSHFDLDTGNPIKLAKDLFKAFDVELMDLYLDFLGFLTPEQADKMGAFKDYFTRNCAKDLMEKVLEHVQDKEARKTILSQLKSTLTAAVPPCEMCAGMLGTMAGQPALARYCFNMFPHRRETRAQMYKTAAPAPAPAPAPSVPPPAADTTRDAASVTVDYEADHSSSGEETDAMSVDPEPAPAPPEETAKQTAPTAIKMEPAEDPAQSITVSIETGEDQDSSHSLSDFDDDNLKIEDTSDWTKNEDRLILQVLQEHLTREERKGTFENNKSIIDLLEEKNVYVMLYESLTDRSLNQIKERVLYLLTMLVISEKDT